ncbi:MAG: hypothetical protein PUB39_02305 [Eubacteriales bacterium]|nr:hypothetical protein [Eubacteriales bacterium]
MTREWQQTRFKEFVMPDAVYYQSIWAVRDLNRMEEELGGMDKDINDGKLSSVSLVKEGNGNYDMSRPTEEQAVKKATLESRVNAINSALDTVPQYYRPYIIDNIVYKNSGKDFPNRMWRVWKQRFLFNVAKNLSIM